MDWNISQNKTYSFLKSIVPAFVRVAKLLTNTFILRDLGGANKTAPIVSSSNPPSLSWFSPTVLVGLKFSSKRSDVRASDSCGIFCREVSSYGVPPVMGHLADQNLRCFFGIKNLRSILKMLTCGFRPEAI